MRKQTKILFFFTSEYPYGKKEAFIENEALFLAKYFDKVVVITNTKKRKHRPIPKNFFVEYLDYELPSKFLYINSLFKKHFWKELYSIKSRYSLKITPIIIKTMLASLSKRYSFQKKIESIYDKYIEPNSKVWFYSYWANDISLSISFFATKKNIPAITRAHGWDVYFEVNYAQYLPFRELLFSNLSKIFFISNVGKSYYEKLLPKYKNKYEVSYLGVFHFGKSSPKNFSDYFIIVSCSNIIPIKRIELIIESLSIIDKFKIKWIHFGDGPLMKSIQQEAYIRLNNKDNITFRFTGEIPNKKIIEFYKDNHVDLFINTSLSEGIPVSIMEAMSFGIPVIATDVGGTHEIVNQENGYLLPSDPSPQIIAQTIKNYFLLPPEEKQLKQKMAYETWNNKFNAEKNYKDFIERLLSL